MACSAASMHLLFLAGASAIASSSRKTRKPQQAAAPRPAPTRHSRCRPRTSRRTRCSLARPQTMMMTSSGGGGRTAAAVAAASAAAAATANPSWLAAAPDPRYLIAVCQHRICAHSSLCAAAGCTDKQHNVKLARQCSNAKYVQRFLAADPPLLRSAAQQSVTLLSQPSKTSATRAFPVHTVSHTRASHPDTYSFRRSVVCNIYSGGHHGPSSCLSFPYCDQRLFSA